MHQEETDDFIDTLFARLEGGVIEGRLAIGKERRAGVALHMPIRRRARQPSSARRDHIGNKSHSSGAREGHRRKVGRICTRMAAPDGRKVVLQYHRRSCTFMWKKCVYTPTKESAYGFPALIKNVL